MAAETYAGAVASFIKSVVTNDVIFYPMVAKSSDPSGFSTLLGLNDVDYVTLLKELKLYRYMSQHKAWICPVGALDSFIINNSLGGICKKNQSAYLNSTRSTYIQIGNFSAGMETNDALSPSDSTLPPIPGLIEKQVLLKSKLKGILEAAPKTPTHDTVDDAKRVHEENKRKEAEEQTFIKTCLERELLPLMFESNILSGSRFWRKDISIPEVTEVILTLAKQLIAQRLRKRCLIMKQAAMSPFSERLKLPSFAEFGIPRDNRVVVNNLLRDIINLDKEKPHYNLLHAEMENGVIVTLVRVPQCATLDRLQRNDRLMNFTDKILGALVRKPKNNKNKKNITAEQESNNVVSEGLGITNSFEIKNTSDAVTAFMIHVGKRYRPNMKSACRKLGLVLGDAMDVVATYAMWSSANVNYAQQREIARHLRAWFERQLVASEEMVKKVLGSNFVHPEESGTILNGKERVQWTCRNVKKLLRHYLESVFNSPDEGRATQFDQLDVVLSLDHGKGFSRAIVVFILRKLLESGIWTELHDTFLLANAQCAKDTEDILSRSFMPKVNEGFEELVACETINVYQRTCNTESSEGSGGILTDANPVNGEANRNVAAAGTQVGVSALSESEANRAASTAVAQQIEANRRECAAPTQQEEAGRIVAPGEVQGAGPSCLLSEEASMVDSADSAAVAARIEANRRECGVPVQQERTGAPNSVGCTTTQQQHYVCLGDEEPTSPSDEAIFYPIKVECMVASDISQYMMNQGREGYASWWCPYCSASHKEWQERDHVKARLWTIERLEQHSLRVTDNMPPAIRRGVTGVPMLSAIDIDHQMIPTLHVGLGVTNTMAEQISDDLQAAAEKWSDKYVELERIITRTKDDVERLQKFKKVFNSSAQHKLMMRMEKRVSEGLISKDEMVELKELREKVAFFKAAVENNKKSLVTLEKEMEDEAKIPENTKAHGQPVRGMVEDVWKSNGIDRGAYFGGDLQGEACRRLMGKRTIIMEQVKEKVKSLPEEQKIVKDVDIMTMLDTYERLLGHLDALFSLCRIKRFHITDEQIQNADEHCKHILALWRALGLSVTVKVHIIEDHVVDYLRRFQGIGDLGEDEGERGHQIGAHDESRSKSLRDVTLKAIAHAQWESMGKNESVLHQKAAVQEKLARKRRSTVAEENAKRRKKARDEARDSLLLLPVVGEARIETLQQKRKRHWVGDGEVRAEAFTAFTLT